MDQRRSHAGDVEQAVAVGQDLAEAEAHDQEHVGPAKERADRGGLREARVAGVARARVVEEVLVAEADDHRQAVRLGEGAQAGPAGIAPAAATRQHQRRLGAREEPGDLVQVFRRDGGLRYP